jgi:hypothetical protein
MYYDFNGNPLTMWEWAALWEDDAGRIIEQTTIGEVRVSTVWMGLDMNYMHIGPPHIFETMVFGPHPLDHMQWRWATVDQAIKAHVLIVDRIRSEIDLLPVDNE